MVVWLEYLPSVFRIKYGNCQLLVWICTYGYASIRQVFQENVSLTACSNQYFKHQNCSKKQAKIHVLYIWFHVKLITVWSKYVWVFALFSSSVRYWILSCSKSHIFWHDTYFDMMHILTWQVYWHVLAPGVEATGLWCCLWYLESGRPSLHNAGRVRRYLIC